MLILCINAGSSSLRLTVFAKTKHRLERLINVREESIDEPTITVLNDLLESIDTSKIELIVHRVVHGGSVLTSPHIIDTTVETQIESLVPLAPLHNPVALAWIRLLHTYFGKQTTQVAVFDTAFYQDMPKVASSYALPRKLSQSHAIRRYGFHGIAHRAMSLRWQQLAPEIKNGGRVISLQLGSGCSITAIDQGKAVDTSMGFSPLEGLVMGTRCGDLDATVITFLQQQAGLSVEKINQLLNKESGLLGLSGLSNDMRVLLNSNTPDAQFAIDLYCYRICKYIGAYLTVLGGADAILFGGGVGENSPDIRDRIIKTLQWLGIKIDSIKNENCQGNKKDVCISATDSSVSVWVIPVDEAEMMVSDALPLVKALNEKQGGNINGKRNEN